MSVGISLTAEDTVLFLDVRSTQNNILSSFCICLAHPIKTKTFILITTGILQHYLTAL